MDKNWTYVAAGYAITAGVLGSYATFVWRKLRRVARLDRRSEP